VTDNVRDAPRRRVVRATRETSHVDESDIARAELDALRTELLARSQIHSGLVATALTIIAAIGGFALAKRDGRTEMLLVLPLVLSALAILQIEGTLATRRMADYIRDHLWKRLGAGTGHDYPSWEHYLQAFRDTNQRRASVYLATGSLPAALIFVAPSVAALVITSGARRTDLWPLWWLGCMSLVFVAALGLSLLRSPAPPRPPNT
jgi:hypothetical protein